MAIALKPAREHSYRLSVYQRRANDFYPTPSDLAINLALGLPRLGPGLVAPMRTHSEKPDEFYALVERVCPAPRHCELFSRRGRPNWDGHGDEHRLATRPCEGRELRLR